MLTVKNYFDRVIHLEYVKKGEEIVGGERARVDSIVFTDDEFASLSVLEASPIARRQ